MSEHEHVQGLGDPGSHEIRIRSALLGDSPISEEQLHRLKAGCAACRAQLEEHAQIQAFLDSGGELEQDSVLREALERDQFPGDEYVEAALRGLIEAGPPPARGGLSRRLRLLPGLLAAAGLIVAVIATGTFENENPVRPTATHLGPAQQGALHAEVGGRFEPRGPVENYGPIVWDAKLPSFDCVFICNIYADLDGARGDALATAELDDGRWELTQEQRTALPGRIRVEVHVENGSGERVGSPFSLSLTRSKP